MSEQRRLYLIRRFNSGLASEGDLEELLTDYEWVPPAPKTQAGMKVELPEPTVTTGEPDAEPEQPKINPSVEPVPDGD